MWRRKFVAIFRLGKVRKTNLVTMTKSTSLMSVANRQKRVVFSTLKSTHSFRALKGCKNARKTRFWDKTDPILRKAPWRIQLSLYPELAPQNPLKTGKTTLLEDPQNSQKITKKSDNFRTKFHQQILENIFTNAHQKCHHKVAQHFGQNIFTTNLRQKVDDDKSQKTKKWRFWKTRKSRV